MKDKTNSDSHSKTALMKTRGENFVIEASSNLDENPKMERFSWDNDKELYDWRKGILEALANV